MYGKFGRQPLASRAEELDAQSFDLMAHGALRHTQFFGSTCEAFRRAAASKAFSAFRAGTRRSIPSLNEKNSGKVEKRCFASNSALVLLIGLPREAHSELNAIRSGSNVEALSSRVDPDPSALPRRIRPLSTRSHANFDGELDGYGACLERAQQ
jgi:hypothetical protein